MKTITDRQIAQAVTVLKKGGVVAYPTDTSYGLAADSTNPEAIERLYRMKGRNFHRPLHVVPPSLKYLDKIVRISPEAKILMKKFWPGPLTLVLPLRSRNPLLRRISGEQGLGIRQPADQNVLKLVAQLNRPITATSANVSGQPDNYTITGVKRQFAGRALKPDYYLDAGRLKKIIPSTIAVIDKKRVTILRQGPISEQALMRAIKK